jgi:hypothetical protein
MVRIGTDNDGAQSGVTNIGAKPAGQPLLSYSVSQVCII